MAKPAMGMAAKGASRRWTSVALADPQVRVRTQAKVYDRKIERVFDAELIVKVRRILAERYHLECDPNAGDDGLWIFHIAPR